MVHAPTLGEGPETVLAGVWARRPEQARELAAERGGGLPVFERYEALLDVCDAVAFAVPPAAQPELAVQAARAGKAVLLEKPLGESVEAAEALAEAVGEAGVGSLVVLTNRFSDGTRAWLAGVPAIEPYGGRSCFFSGALVGGPYSTSPWRTELGELFDVGPHAIDIIDAALGPVVGVQAHRRRGWVGLLLDHEGGAMSEVSLSCRAPIESITDVEVFGTRGRLALDARKTRGPSTWANLRADFARVARTGEPHECDAQRGLHLQRILDQAASQL
jgi:predicted dehydrogenase